MWGDAAVNFNGLVHFATADTEVVDSSGGLGVGAVALTIVAAVILAWMAYLFVNSRRSRGASAEAAPSNLTPHVSDEELENTKLTNVLRAALFGSVLLAVALPWYAFNEPDRQAEAAESIAEFDVEEGSHWFSHDGFACADCHGPDGGGGGAPTTEERSGVDTNWAVPSLNDVFFRYSEEEVRYWITFGRAQTPMPANGLVGGGAMTVQEIDQTIAYIQSIQLSQADAFAKGTPSAERALQAIENGAVVTQSLINRQEADIEDVNAAQGKMDVVGTYPDNIKDLFQAPGTCTVASAALIDSTCEQPGTDTDRDGLTDEAEKALSAMATSSMDTITVIAETITAGEPVTYSFDPNPAYDVRFDPFVAFTNENPATKEPEADLDVADTMLSNLENDVLLLSVTAERSQQFLDGLLPGLAFLEESLASEPWSVDFDAVAEAMSVSVDDARLAVGLFNATCARCHTGGYSAGQAFEQGAGSGAWGPSLVDGRSSVQFPNHLDQIAFVVEGSVNAKGYGVNGIGTGRMPGFGNVLSADQIELIVAYERTL